MGNKFEQNEAEKNNVIPIEFGEKRKLHREDEWIERLKTEIDRMIQQVFDLEGEKEEQLREELEKPFSEENLELISLLQNDLEELKRCEGELLDMMNKTFDEQQKLRDRLDKIWEKLNNQRSK